MADLLDIPEFLQRWPEPGVKSQLLQALSEGVLREEELDVSPPAVLPDDLRWQKVYYMLGSAPKHMGHKYWIKDAPHLGQSLAFLIGAEDAGKITVFCPYTIWSAQVRPDAGEIIGYGPEPLTEDALARLVSMITHGWEEFASMGFQRDYDVAALVLTKLGAEVPKISIQDAEAQTGRPVKEKKERRGGKPHADELIKPVTRTSKRGQVAEFFLGSDQKSIRECMARMSMTRNSVLSALSMLNKDHGIGYETVNDTASILIPIDWDIWK